MPVCFQTSKVEFGATSEFDSGGAAGTEDIGVYQSKHYVISTWTNFAR